MDGKRLSHIYEKFNFIIRTLKKRAKELKQNISLLYRAYKHPDTPWYVKVITIMTITYALSPIDLIPDFIPILGYLDDLLIVPAGIALSLKLIPKEIIEECRQVSGDNENIKNKGILAALVIILLWIWIIILLLRAFHVI